jgi:predicted unusual protein kinase regulating ubiquinone biosynthesis (AarF/ABC1/UbiB family)
VTRREDGATRRALRMASMTAGVTGSYLGYLAQSVFLGEEAREKKLKSTHAKAGRRMTTELQDLRGPAMKLGQLLSLQAGVLPEEALTELATLQRSAPGMHPSLVRAQFKAAMGVQPEALFKSFDEKPFAAASLGQVHRAVTRNGELVAVKIQYPGIRDAVQNDFKLLRTVAAASQMKRYLPDPLMNELEQQIIAETDYAREATNVDFFHQALSPLGFVSTPRAYPELSRGSVLTLSMVEGDHLDEFLAMRPSQRLRDLVGERLLELFYYQVVKVEALHADPHWGNYLFRRDGTIGLVDFGCVKYLSPDSVANLRALFLYPGPRDSAEFRHLLNKQYAGKGRKLSPKTVRAFVQFCTEFYEKVYPPDKARDQERFDFSDAQVLRLYIRGAHNLVHSKGVLPEYAFLARAESGLYNTLHRLKARVRTSAIVRRYL